MKEYKHVGNDTQAKGVFGWVPAIQEPYYRLFRKECWIGGEGVCGEKFWSLDGYRAHVALRHILGL
jgi:hypothetical protein